MKNGRNHGSTPQALFAWANKRWGPFGLDAAADPWNAKCRRYLTEKDDALAPEVRWTGRVWLNPPWSKIDPWVRKAHIEVMQHEAILVVMLLPTRTGQAWYQEVARPFAPQHLIRGRVRFDNPPGEEQGKGGFEDCGFYVFERPLFAKDLR